MPVRRALPLLALLSGSCLVHGFSIVDGQAGASGSDSGQSGTSQAAGAAQAGSGNAGSGNGNGGKSGNAGSANNGGDATNGGVPSTSDGGTGEGGAPSGSVTLPCDLDSTGMPPLLCDDFESGLLDGGKWQAPPGLAVEAGAGPHGQTKLVYLEFEQLQTHLLDLELATDHDVTISFWLQLDMLQEDGGVMSFNDGLMDQLRLVIQQKELSWHSASNQDAPFMPTQAMIVPGEWTCVSLHLTDTSMALRYQAQGQPAPNTLLVDDQATQDIDDAWQNQPAERRFVTGAPSFGSEPVFPSQLYIDDVRIARGTSSICD